ARRYGVKRRNVPIYLLRKLVSAGHSGSAAVPLGNDIYLVHESALVATLDDHYRYVEVPEDERFELVYSDEEEEDEILFAPPPAPRPSLYAALAKGAEFPDGAPPDAVDEAFDDPDDDFAWRS